ncbi:hypothetical protein [Streptantibioticus silvisoli]|uniref:Uncharacterized protein n=1 Tax=Streptantibioticus silvisoli TaxID=2705255 RepID=A0ABT6W623_9ACTN|nr:hypothetical protein [Streptantibioticus silvisoli]MDI5965734.1 hypothetical protein [Streptantibioticus silvisoli]
MTARTCDEWRALDAPFQPGDWQPRPGHCSRCGQPALAGVTRWWRLGDTCRANRTAVFVAD